MHEVTKQHPENITKELQAMLRNFRWTATPLDAAQIRAEERYRQEREAFVHSKRNKDWMKRHSCGYGIIGCHFAVIVGLVKWESVETFFDWMEWGGSEAVPYHASKLKGCIAYRNGIRIEWTDKFELIDTPGRFIVIPLSSIDGNIDERLNAYQKQYNQPTRIRLKAVDIPTYCKNFDSYAQPFRSHNESEKEWEHRLLRKFVEVFDYIT